MISSAPVNCELLMTPEFVHGSLYLPSAYEVVTIAMDYDRSLFRVLLQNPELPPVQVGREPLHEILPLLRTQTVPLSGTHTPVRHVSLDHIVVTLSQDRR